MRRELNLFMWGFQPHFRVGLENRSKEVIKEIAPTVEPKSLLIGIRTPEKKEGHPVCVEPEDGEWDPSIFFKCKERSEEIFESHPDQNIYFGDDLAMRDKPENIRKKSVLQAVEEVVSDLDLKNGTKTYCGVPTRVEGYHVVPILQFQKNNLMEYPALSEPISLDQGYHKYISSIGLLDSLIKILLKAATKKLEDSEPGRFLFSINKIEILRETGSLLCQAISYAVNDLFLQDVFETINIISSLSYENEGAHGELVFIPREVDTMGMEVCFHKPISLYDARMARKIIEMSGENLAGICDGSNGIRGLGEAKGEFFRILFTGHYRWDLYYGGKILMNVRYGVPGIPQQRLKKADFVSNVRRIFNDGRCEPDKLWQIIEGTMEQKHGTMLVISREAKVESDRLNKQSIGVCPFELNDDLIRRLSAIDGAVLIDPKGTCFAIGVILDGLATDQGDSSRGARYNSAVRYINSVTHPTLCLVVSEDGYIDLIPKLRPQILKSKIKDKIIALKTRDIDNYHKIRNWFDEYRFYLTPLECEEVNKEIARIENTPLEHCELRTPTRKFEPDPQMDDSYYAEESE